MIQNNEANNAGRARILLLACLFFVGSMLINLAGNCLHSTWDRDESRYAEASRAMVAGGDWIVPHFNGGIRYDKPVFIYWMIGGAMKCFGITEYAVRFPAAIAGAIVVTLVFFMALSMGGGLGGASAAAAIIMTCPLLAVMFKSGSTDAVLLLTIVGALALHWWQTKCGFSWWRHLAFWIVLGVSALVKGPPGVVVIGSAVILHRILCWIAKRRHPTECHQPHSPAAGKTWGRTFVGLATFLVVTLPWVVTAWRQTNGDFFMVAIRKHAIAHTASALEGHDGPVFYYLPVLCGALFAALPLVFASIPYGWRQRSQPQWKLLWCWLASAFIIFSFMRTKLPHYICPAIPALALMAGLLFGAACRGGLAARGTVGTICWRFGIAMVILVGGVACAALAYAPMHENISVMILPAAVMATLTALTTFVAAIYWWRYRAVLALTVSSVGLLLNLGVGIYAMLPAIEPLRPSKNIVEFIKKVAPPETTLAAVQYQEPSLVFYWGGLVNMIAKRDPNESFDLFSDPKRPVALVIPERIWVDWLCRRLPVFPSCVDERMAGNYYLFQSGGWERLIVVGNW
ncbi:MAG: glycosyltransferase family 39 protein [Candidatus Sumerlaeota bacterium]|nr:glycosyltransferase family 39 protein [Candidatus Sumerlaeota bacterium]